MGCCLCRPFEDPVWFSYYGPIHQPDAVEAINAAVAEHLQEIGAGPRIPIRRAVAAPLRVPVALNNPCLTGSDTLLTLHFSANEPGVVTIQTDTSLNSFNYDPQSQQQIDFERPQEDIITIKFGFDSIGGVTARMYTVKISSNNESVITDDKVVIDGVVSTISKVYRQQDDNGSGEGFSEGLCLICCAETATVVVFPCRHCCMCRSCSDRFATLSSHCPFCRAAVTELIECVAEGQSQ